MTTTRRRALKYPAPQTSRSRGPVPQLPLTRYTHDSSGNMHDGVLAGDMQGVTSPVSGFGNAAQFDGGVDSGGNIGIDLGDSNQPGHIPMFTGTTPWTMECIYQGTSSTPEESIAGWFSNTFQGPQPWINGNGTLGFFWTSAGSGSGFFGGSTNVTDGNVHYLAWVYDGTQFYIFLDGNLEATSPDSAGQAAAPPGPLHLWIGSDDSQEFLQPGIAVLDEFRISSVARYTSNYTPATSPFTTDANTIALYHLDDLPFPPPPPPPVQVNDSDVGTGVDNQSIAIPITSSDIGTGSDSQSVVQILTITDSDSGSGFDTHLLSQESAIGYENPFYFRLVTYGDTGTGLDQQPAVVSTLIIEFDVGLGTETVSLPIPVGIADIDLSAGVDVETILSKTTSFVSAPIGGDPSFSSWWRFSPGAKITVPGGYQPPPSPNTLQVTVSMNTSPTATSLPVLATNIDIQAGTPLYLGTTIVVVTTVTAPAGSLSLTIRPLVIPLTSGTVLTGVPTFPSPPPMAPPAPPPGTPFVDLRRVAITMPVAALDPSGRPT